MYYSAYNKLFWGFILIFININIGPFDILPNFIGYFLICSGATELTAQHPAFEKVKVPALLLGFLTIKDVYKAQPQPILDITILNQNILWIIYDQIVFVISLYVVFSVVNAIYLVAKEKNLLELSERAENNWKTYFITSLAVGFSTPFLLNLSKGWQTGYFILAIISLIAAFLIMGLTRRARNELGNEGNQV